MYLLLLFAHLLKASFLQKFWIPGLFYAFSREIFGDYLAPRKISPFHTTKKQLRFEQYHAFWAVLAHGLIIGMLVLGNGRFFHLYKDPYQYGKFWFFFQIPFLIFYVDWGFYIQHRLMHTRWLFFIHRTHHRSKYANPWTSLSMSMAEVFMYYIPILIFIHFVPVHELIFVSIAFFFQIVSQWHHHCGYELFSKNLYKIWGFKYIQSSTFHELHHNNVVTNYSAGFFNIWDRIFGSFDPSHDEKLKSLLEKSFGENVREDYRKVVLKSIDVTLVFNVENKERKILSQLYDVNKTGLFLQLGAMEMEEIKKNQDSHFSIHIMLNKEEYIVLDAGLRWKNEKESYLKPMGIGLECHFSPEQYDTLCKLTLVSLYPKAKFFRPFLKYFAKLKIENIGNLHKNTLKWQEAPFPMENP